MHTPLGNVIVFEQVITSGNDTANDLQMHSTGNKIFLMELPTSMTFSTSH